MPKRTEPHSHAGQGDEAIQPIDLVRGVILRKCGSASATPLGGKYIRVCAHTIKNSCTVVQVHEVDTCSDRWLITVVLSAAQTVLVRTVSTVSLQLDKGQTLIWPLSK